MTQLARVITMIFAVAASGCGACDDDASVQIENEGSSSAGGAEGEAARAALDGMRTHLDLLALAHLADVDRGGPWIDFGTPARMKHTNGQWRNQWRRDGSD